MNNTHTGRELPYGSYKVFLKTRIKKTTIDLIYYLPILLALHYKRPPPVTFRGVLGCSKP
jgi:hypothetical protein